MDTKQENVETGEAEIKISLSDGVITVRHGEDGTILAQWTGRRGDWNALWKTIDNLKKRSLK